MTSWISHSGAPGWISQRTLQCLSECQLFPLSGDGGGMVFIIIVITYYSWQQSVCLFSYYPIQSAIHYKPISKNTEACWDQGWGRPGQVGSEITKTLF